MGMPRHPPPGMPPYHMEHPPPFYPMVPPPTADKMPGPMQQQIHVPPVRAQTAFSNNMDKLVDLFQAL